MAQDPQLLKHAARMRHDATPFEVIMWRHLSRSQLGGYKFRRQHVVGAHIVDFFCPAKGLAVEVDGDTHTPSDDQQRDMELSAMSVQVIHFSNREVSENIEGVLQQVKDKLDSLPDRWVAPTPNPSPEGDGLEQDQTWV